MRLQESLVAGWMHIKLIIGVIIAHVLILNPQRYFAQTRRQSLQVIHTHLRFTGGGEG